MSTVYQKGKNHIFTTNSDGDTINIYPGKDETLNINSLTVDSVPQNVWKLWVPTTALSVADATLSPITKFTGAATKTGAGNSTYMPTATDGVVTFGKTGVWKLTMAFALETASNYATIYGNFVTSVDTYGQNHYSTAIGTTHRMTMTTYFNCTDTATDSVTCNVYQDSTGAQDLTDMFLFVEYIG